MDVEDKDIEGGGHMNETRHGRKDVGIERAKDMRH